MMTERGNQSRLVKQAKSLNFAFLNLAEHPRGCAMLGHLLAAGFHPAVVIEEHSTLAEKSRAFFQRELPPAAFPPACQTLLQGRAINYSPVSNHNDEECERILREVSPELVVLGDTRIIRPAIRSLPQHGVINTHPGWLPDVRGNNPYIWALIDDLPMGCACHFIDEAIDTGPIILRRKLRIYRSHTLGRLLVEINQLCGELITQALRRYVSDQLTSRPQKVGAFVTYTKAPPEALEAAKAKLAAGTYRYALPTALSDEVRTA